MIDINTFLLMLMYILGSILLVFLIILVVKLIGAVNHVNDVMDELHTRLGKLDQMFRVVDMVTDNMAMVSDKVVDGISYLIRKIFYKKENGKEEEKNESR